MVVLGSAQCRPSSKLIYSMNGISRVCIVPSEHHRYIIHPSGLHSAVRLIQILITSSNRRVGSAQCRPTDCHIRLHHPTVGSA